MFMSMWKPLMRGAEAAFSGVLLPAARPATESPMMAVARNRIVVLRMLVPPRDLVLL
jgi:hypothetical protein